MNSNQQGLADSDIEVDDQSFLIQAGLQGIVAVLGLTERGIPNDPANGLAGSWIEYTRKFGGLIPESLFPLLCKRALDGGSTLRISRAQHYTDITDRTTATGVKATQTGSSAIPIITSTIATTTGGSLPTGTRYYKLVAVYGNGALSAPSAESNVANTGTTSKNTITGVVVPGAASYRLYYGTGAGTEANFIVSNTPVIVDEGTAGTAGAVPTAQTAVLTAYSAGNWANAGGLIVSINSAISGIAGKVDIHVRMNNYDDLAVDLYDITQAIQSTEKSNVNAALQYAAIGTVTGALPIGTFNNFATGDAQNAAVVAADYIGDVQGQTGLHSFDSETDFVKLMVPEMAITDIDDAIDAYQKMRKDFIGCIRTPTGLNGDQSVAYRERTGTYTGVPIDNPYMFMFAGGVKVTDPLSGNVMNISELGDVAGCMSTKDNNTQAWFSFAGAERGGIGNGVLGVAYNFGTSARETEASNVDQHGINCVLKNEFGVTIWGNNTLQKSNTLLKKAEVAELLIYLRRTLNPAIRIKLFNPNDPTTWKTIYDNVKKIMDPVKTNRGVWKWMYQGDQDILDPNDAVINLQATRDAGKYIFYLYVAPIVGMKYVQVKIVVTNSGVDYSVGTGAGAGATA